MTDSAALHDNTSHQQLPLSPRVAVVIVNYCSAEFTLECVRSLERSEGVVLDTIVVDNASGDDSVEVLRRGLPASVRLVESQVNGGFTGGNNIGLGLARTLGVEWIFLINNDTILDPHCISSLVADAEQDDTIALSNPKIFFGHPSGTLWFGGSRFSLWTGRALCVGWKRPESHALPVASDIPFATGCALLIRTVHLDRIGLLDESLFGYSEDLDWSLTAREAGLRLRFVPEAKVWHYEGISYRRAGGEALRQYLSARNALRVVGRHARWYHWPTFLATFVVDHIGRFTLLSLLRRDLAALRGTYRGVLHFITGGRSSVEHRAEEQRRAIAETSHGRRA